MVTIQFLGQCGFLITNEKIRIAIDLVLTELIDHGQNIRNYPPVMEPEELHADYIFCTHDHIDHMEIKTLQREVTEKEDTKIVVPAGCKDELFKAQISSENIISLMDGETKDLLQNKLSVKGISVAHPVHQVDENGLDHNLAFAIYIENKCLVHLGDTYLTKRLQNSLLELKEIDVLFAPINGMDEEKAKIGLIGNMSSKEAADLCYKVESKLSVPTHFDMVKGNTENPENFAKALKQLNREAKVWVPKLLETVNIDAL